jgi:hypothetical protein
MKTCQRLSAGSTSGWGANCNTGNRAHRLPPRHVLRLVDVIAPPAVKRIPHGRSAQAACPAEDCKYGRVGTTPRAPAEMAAMRAGKLHARHSALHGRRVECHAGERFRFDDAHRASETASGTSKRNLHRSRRTRKNMPRPRTAAHFEFRAALGAALRSFAAGVRHVWTADHAEDIRCSRPATVSACPAISRPCPNRAAVYLHRAATEVRRHASRPRSGRNSTKRCGGSMHLADRHAATPRVAGDADLRRRARP